MMIRTVAMTEYTCCHDRVNEEHEGKPYNFSISFFLPGILKKKLIVKLNVLNTARDCLSIP